MVNCDKRISPSTARVFASFMLRGQDGSMTEMSEWKCLEEIHGNGPRGKLFFKSGDEDNGIKLLPIKENGFMIVYQELQRTRGCNTVSM